MQTSEKVYQSFRLEVTHPGGHSALPTHDNAIYRLADGLAPERRLTWIGGANRSLGSRLGRPQGTHRPVTA